MATTTPLGMLTSRYGRISATQSLGHDGLGVVVGVAPEKSAGLIDIAVVHTEQLREMLPSTFYLGFVPRFDSAARGHHGLSLSLGQIPRLCCGDGALTGRR
jgi:hypothetical protein